jgi:preprotein translocase subunit SecD
VLQGPEPAAPAEATDSATPTDSAAPTSGPTPTDSAAPTTSAAPTDSAAATSGAATGTAPLDPDAPPVTQEQAAATYATLTCEAENVTGEVTRPDDHVATCSEDGTLKYLLGPTIIEGTQIDDASAATDPATGAWIVLLDFKSQGRTDWAEYTAAHVQENVAFTLDGRVISAPTIQGAINGQTTITGDFTQEEATDSRSPPSWVPSSWRPA